MGFLLIGPSTVSLTLTFKPVIERLNADMESSDTTIMSGKTNVVFLFITNIPEDLDGINQGYLESQINELNQKAFVIVIFVHPLASDDLRSVPYRFTLFLFFVAC